MHKQIYCNNCGKTGHYYLKCKLPIISIGVIAFKKQDDVINNNDSLDSIYQDFYVSNNKD